MSETKEKKKESKSVNSVDVPVVKESAYPHQHRNPDGSPQPPKDGMTLRDYFAGQALTGLMGSAISKALLTSEEVAETAYRTADAMLKARL